MLPCIPWVETTNVGRRLGDFSLGLDEAGLKVDDVITELVILGLNGFVVLIQDSVVANLLFELLDVTFFALPECSLSTTRNVSDATRCRVESCTL